MLATMAALTNTTLSTLNGIAAPRRSRLVVVARAIVNHDRGFPESSRRVVVFGAAAVVTALTAATGRPARAAPGGYHKVDVKDPHVQGLGKWAVGQHNKDESDGVEFGAVFDGENQIVNGVNYNLFIEGKDSRGVPGSYLATVYEKGNGPGVRETLQLKKFVRLLTK